MAQELEGNEFFDPLAIIREVLRLAKKDPVSREMRLRTDLGARSEDVAEMSRIVETRFDIYMPPPEDIITVGDFVDAFELAFGGGLI